MAPTVLFVHGFWLSPRTWDPWVTHFEERGWNAVAPAWPGLDRDVAAVRADPSPLVGLGIADVIDHYAAIIRGMESPPVLVGHSFGGAFVQVLLDRGLGRAAVALHSGPVKGVLRVPPSTVRSNWPVLRNPANRHRTVSLTPKQFRYAFTNALDDTAAALAYETHHVPGPGRMIFEAAMANVSRNAATKVDFRNPDRGPLLFVTGDADHVTTPALNHENHRRYRHSGAVTDVIDFRGRCHYTLGQPGWEEVADGVLGWLEGRGVG